MKKIAAILMVLIMGTWSLRAFASDRLNFNGNSILEKMVRFELSSQPLDIEMNKLENKMEFLYMKNGRDFSRMNDGALKEMIDVQVRYATGKQIIIDGLSQVYFSNYQSREIPIQEKLSSAVTKVTKSCHLLDKLASKCLDEQEALIFQAHYLSLQIQELNALEDSLLSQINSVLEQESKSLYVVTKK